MQCVDTSDERCGVDNYVQYVDTSVERCGVDMYSL